MSLACCPRCGSALSILNQQCRQCADVRANTAWFRKIGVRDLPQIGLAVIGLGILLYELLWMR